LTITKILGLEKNSQSLERIKKGIRKLGSENITLMFNPDDKELPSASSKKYNEANEVRAIRRETVPSMIKYGKGMEAMGEDMSASKSKEEKLLKAKW